MKGSQHAAVTFYSTNSVWMESLRLPAGMYKLIPSKSPDGWRLAVAKQDGEWNDARYKQQYLGSIELKRVASDTPPEKSNLAISLGPGAERCPTPSVRRDVKELHFTFGSTDLFVCFRPDRGQEASHERTAICIAVKKDAWFRSSDGWADCKRSIGKPKIIWSPLSQLF